MAFDFVSGQLKTLNCMRLWMFCSLFLAGCATFNGLEPMCRDADETQLGTLYVERNIEVENFDRFANQCAKYGYRVPSKEKFLESYNKTTGRVCKEPSEYFLTSYKTYHTGGTPVKCAGSSAEFETVKQDAWDAHRLKQEIERLDQDLKESEKKKRYDKDEVLDVVVRAIAERSPARLESDRKEAVEKLKLITTKYNLFISDL